jgi:hypothetical protein
MGYRYAVVMDWHCCNVLECVMKHDESCWRLNMLNEAALTVVQGGGMPSYIDRFDYSHVSFLANQYNNLIEHVRGCKECQNRVTELFVGTGLQSTVEPTTEQPPTTTESVASKEDIENIKMVLLILTNFLCAGGKLTESSREVLMRHIKEINNED